MKKPPESPPKELRKNSEKIQSGQIPGKNSTRAG